MENELDPPPFPHNVKPHFENPGAMPTMGYIVY